MSAPPPLDADASTEHVSPEQDGVNAADGGVPPPRRSANTDSVTGALVTEPIAEPTST